MPPHVHPDFQRGIDALRSQQPEAAAALLAEVVRLEPTNVLAQSALGQAQLQAGDTAAALRSLERAHYLRPEDPLLLEQYGRALLAAAKGRALRPSLCR